MSHERRRQQQMVIALASALAAVASAGVTYSWRPPATQAADLAIERDLRHATMNLLSAAEGRLNTCKDKLNIQSKERLEERKASNRQLQACQAICIESGDQRGAIMHRAPAPAVSEEEE